jgi:hypothetical protein
MESILFLLPYLETGLIYAVSAVVIERLLIIKGIVRGSTVILAITVFVFAVVFQLSTVSKTNSLNLFEIVALLVIAPLKLNQIDLIATIEKGRWWWKKME